MFFSDDSVFRITEIKLSNIKNVTSGSVEFAESCQLYKADDGEIDYRSLHDVLGIYGQNGSGKTAVIHTISLLKDIVMGRSFFVDKKFNFFVKRNSALGYINYTFLLIEKDTKYTLNYAIELEPVLKDDQNNIGCQLKNETFRLEDITHHIKYPTISISADSDDVNSLFSKDADFTVAKIISAKQNSNDFINKVSALLASRQNDYQNHKSFLFDDNTLETLRESALESAKILGEKIKKLKLQITYNIYCYDMNNDALTTIGLGTILGTAKVENNEETITSGVFPIGINGPFEILTKHKKVYANLVEQINIVVNGFIPGFHAEYREVGLPHLSSDGKDEVIAIEMVRTDKDLNLPIMSESNGVRKLINLSSAIICVFNNPSAFLVVDEFDSGVFENLLGQILSVLDNSAKGQILFTSHNLRPLEVLNYKSIYFTTVNSENRYVKLHNVKTTNNVRDFYYRALKVGGQSEELSDETEASQISASLYKGGELFKKVIPYVR